MSLRGRTSDDAFANAAQDVFACAVAIIIILTIFFFLNQDMAVAEPVKLPNDSTHQWTVRFELGARANDQNGLMEHLRLWTGSPTVSYSAEGGKHIYLVQFPAGVEEPGCSWVGSEGQPLTTNILQSNNVEVFAPLGLYRLDLPKPKEYETHQVCLADGIATLSIQIE